MFKSQARNLAFKAGDGLAVAIMGRLSVYEKSGQYQLYVDENGTRWSWRPIPGF